MAVSWILGRYATHHYYLKGLNFSAFAEDNAVDDGDAAADASRQQTLSEPCTPRDLSDDIPLNFESDDETDRAPTIPNKDFGKEQQQWDPAALDADQAGPAAPAAGTTQAAPNFNDLQRQYVP